MSIESQLQTEIRTIVHKYKRMIADAKREKEKLVQIVRGT